MRRMVMAASVANCGVEKGTGWVRDEHAATSNMCEGGGVRGEEPADAQGS